MAAPQTTGGLRPAAATGASGLRTPAPDRRYWAFLSYSHSDARWADWLHRALENYRVPARLVGQQTRSGVIPRRLRPIFRDREEMGAGPSLSDRLKQALSESAYLIVLCSPAAVKSAWVGEEVRLFKSLRGEDRVLAVIVAGEPFASDHPGQADQECLPEALRRFHVDFGEARAGDRAEPVAADLRPGRDGRRRALLKLVAGVLSVDLDELVHRDAQRRHRSLLVITGASIAGAIGAGALAVTAYEERSEALRERREALQERSQAEGLVEFMVGDLRKQLAPKASLKALEAIGKRAQDYLALRGRADDPSSRGLQAQVLRLLGYLQQQQGHPAAALARYKQAFAITDSLLKSRPTDQQFIYDHAQSVAYIGLAAYDRHQFDTALDCFRAYQDLARKLIAQDANSPDWNEELAEADDDVGAALLAQSRATEAEQQFHRALDINARLVAPDPKNRERQWDRSQILAWHADAESALGRPGAALADREAESQVYRVLLQLDPADTDAAVAWASNEAKVADLRMATQDVPAAMAELSRAAAEMDRLVREAPDDATYKANYEPILLALARTQLAVGELKPAAQSAERATELGEAQVQAVRAAGDDALTWEGDWLGEARVIALEVAAAQAAAPAAQRRALAPAPAESARLRGLVVGNPQDHSLAAMMAEAALLEGDLYFLDRRPGDARAQWTRARNTVSQAEPSTVATIDHLAKLSRQLDFRLAAAHPPTGPLGRAPPRAVGSASVFKPIYYEW